MKLAKFTQCGAECRVYGIHENFMTRSSNIMLIT